MSTNTAFSSSGAALKVDIVKYEPYPAEIGKYVDVWVKIENIYYGRASDVSIELVPSYPFSLDSKKNAVKNIGILSPDSEAVHEYHLFVDSDAKPDTSSIKIRYQDDKGVSWFEESFDIKVGSDTFDSKGTLQLEEIKTEPEVLMPGDSGTVTIVLKNSATQNTITLDGKDYDTNAHVQSASLSSIDDIIVDDESYQGSGVLGPGDAMTLTFNVDVDGNAKEGTHLMDFSVIGSSHSYNSKWDIPIKVDSAGIKVIPTKPLTIDNGVATIQFDVVNTHPNTLTSVSIRPQAEGIEFSPLEYFIGTMNHDELFTIEFDARPISDDVTTQQDITLITQYMSGFNQHETILNGLNLSIVSEKQNSNIEFAGVSVLFSIFVVSGLVMYRRKKHQ
ncbi:MAG: COG1361 S-layer family protein [Methanosarcinaceae archaeon]|nr:COG1361 S-layer family protein [Methanosarcinaceae archaeon]